MPAQQLLPHASPERVTAPRVHWVCVLVAEAPHISLCGELTGGRRLAELAGMCDDCLTLAAAHSATCPHCAEWVGAVA